MKSVNKKIVENSLKKIAASEGITPEEVRQEIALAISYALKSDEPNAQNFWKNIPCENNVPTVDEVVEYLAIQISEQQK